MVRVCAFPGCSNREKPLRLRQASSQEESLTFHTLPLHDRGRLALWLLALRRDLDSPIESLRTLRVCGDHFSPDDFSAVPGTKRRLLRATAVPGQSVHRTEETVSGSYLQIGPHGELQSKLILTVPNSEPSTSSSSLGAYYALPPTWYYQSDEPEQAELRMEDNFDVDDSMDSVAHPEGVLMACEDSTEYLTGDSDSSPEVTPDTVNPCKQNSTETGEEDPDPQESLMEGHQIEDTDINTEDTAQCSEELVITKVEDLRDEMPLDEMDRPDFAEAETAKDVKNRNMESSSGTQTKSVLKLSTNPHVVPPSDVLPVKIKDEPMDEEYKREPQTPMGNIQDDEEFNQTPDEIKIRAGFSIGGNATFIGAPTATSAKAPSVHEESVPGVAPLKPIGLVCAGCKKVMLKGQTAFQRSGSAKLFCSPQCLCSTSTMVVKKKTCHYCLNEILDMKGVLNAPVDMAGTLKQFCSQKCLGDFNFKCRMCQKTCVTHSHEVNVMGTVHKLCSDDCFNQFRSSNKLTMNCCMNCSGYCNSTDGQCPTLQIEGSVTKFCSQNCLKAHKKKNLKPVTCKMCRAVRLAADMVDSPNSEGIRELFCSHSCATASKGQTANSSGKQGAPVECNNCKQKLVPQYHLAMFDGTVQNFCSLSCVVAYQESLNKKKSKKEAKTVTSTSKSISTPKSVAPKTTAAPKSALPESSLSTKTTTPSGQGQTVTKLPCCQCLQSFFHKPELLEFQRKMYAFCGDACVVEFRRINKVKALCEYCKVTKVVKIVKRINYTDLYFCEEKCNLLYEQNLTKRWGKKHCRSCLYCNGSSKTLVTGLFNNKLEEFCGKECLTKYTALTRQEVKCGMCRQAKKLTESVKWLDEIKHFCSLRCLMFFCSLQGITGAVIKAAGKSLPTQGTTPSSAVPQGTKEATPVIAKVVSLSSASSGQPGGSAKTDLKGSVPSVTVEVTEEGDDSRPKRMGKDPQVLKNKASNKSKSKSKNKATTCKPNTCDVEIQIDKTPKVIVLPVPVPVYVPLPMHLYSQYIPQSVGIPLPVPVPLFFPTTLDSAERIVETIQEIKEKIPDDPLEADLILMAEMVAEDAEKEKTITSIDQTCKLKEDLELKDLSSNQNWKEDSVFSAQTCNQDQTPKLGKPPTSKSTTPTPISTPAEESQIYQKADIPVASQEQQKIVKQRAIKRGHDSIPEKRRCAETMAATSASDTFTNLSKLQHEYGVSAWKDWVRWRNTQPNLETPKCGSRSMTLKEDLLNCSPAELSYGLSKFISEVRRPNGEKYSPDSIFYLCLSIQQHLFENNRMENIFVDNLYSKFCQDMTNILKGWKPALWPSGNVHSRVEEKYLWDCKQLGAFSPSVLLNTLIYFFTKFFYFKTVEQHRRLCFGNVKRYSVRKVSYLRFYPPVDDTDTVPAKKRKKEDDKKKVLKIRENTKNPLRCPVRLYEFYLSKCSPSVRQHENLFYLSPERSCVPSSPMWFSTTSLTDEALDSMLTRILTVRELHVEEDKSPNENDSDSDSD
ncbi:zinc finger MYM-type protein 4-like isoform X2 [Myxocyprinus asiaticus]|uniref:zinc finger MYM-type protein 4-like isoform X2 n=1 Tax=Myxocyprinus asiaticus TaxID=70543 RepID=UPI002222B36B|nr:zinc finger MYM-type protein 4-like isoform X2 [Myxocyprinus asiaticus]